jgi:hypothetical protein
VSNASAQPIAPVDQARLKQALTSGLQIGATEIRFLNIDVYRARLGEKWLACKDLIHSYVLSATERHLDTSDFLIPSSSGYVLVFANANSERVDRITKSVANDVDAMLARVDDFQHPPVSCNIIAVDTSTLYSHLHATPPPQSVVEGAGTRSTPASSDDGVDVAARFARYAPLFHQKTQNVVGSISVPTPVGSPRRLLDRAYYEPSDVRTHADIQMFGELLAASYKLQKVGKSAAVVFSINFRNFCQPALHKQYTHALRQTPSGLLKRLTPRLVRIPPGTHRTLIASKLDSLMPIFSNIAIHSKPTVEIAALEFLPIAMISTSWSDIELAAGGQKSELLRHRELLRIVSLFCQSARVLRAKSMIDGVDSKEALEIISGADADFVSGPIIGAIENNLRAPSPRQLQDQPRPEKPDRLMPHVA